MQHWISRNFVFALVGLSLCNLQSVATNNQLDLVSSQIAFGEYLYSDFAELFGIPT